MPALALVGMDRGLEKLNLSGIVLPSSFAFRHMSTISIMACWVVGGSASKSQPMSLVKCLSLCSVVILGGHRSAAGDNIDDSIGNDRLGRIPLSEALIKTPAQSQCCRMLDYTR